jgi:hypothetical protein
MVKTYYKKEKRVFENEDTKEEFKSIIKNVWLLVWGIWTFILFIQSITTHLYYLNPEGWNNPAILFLAIPTLLVVGSIITITSYFSSTKTKYSKWNSQ